MVRRIVATLGCVAAVTCSSPTGPTPDIIAPPLQPPPEAFVLDGRWEGTYRIGRAEPSNCGVLTGCTQNPTVTLTLTRAGDDLTGILQHSYGRFEVKGRVNDATEITLFSEPVPVSIPCSGRPTASGEARLIQWSTRLMGGKSLVGTFTSQIFTLFNVGGTNLCPSGNVTVFAEDVRLTRVPPTS